MGKYQIKLTEQAVSDLRDLRKSATPAVVRKVERLVLELSEHPYEGIGHPERLKENYSGLWSRQIDKKNRLIYAVKESDMTIIIISAKGHYSDK